MWLSVTEMFTRGINAGYALANNYCDCMSAILFSDLIMQ